MSNREDLLRKLKALSERGEGGEAINATEKLKQLMKRYGMKENDLEDDVREYRDFKYSGHFEGKLLEQIIYMVMGDVQVYCRNRNGRNIPNLDVVYCTNAEQIEIQAAFDFYKYHLNAGFEKYYIAFVQREDLFPDPSKQKTNSKPTVIDDDTRRLYYSMDKHSRYLQLEAGQK